MKKAKIILITFTLLLIAIYIILSLYILRGSLFPVHYYSYNTINECKQNKTFVSNDLKILVEGDSLKRIKNINKKFFTCKSMFQQYYGFLISEKKEDENFRRLQWYENYGFVKNRNWIILNEDKYIGEAFYSGSLDVKIGDTVKLDITNFKPEYKIGTLKIIVR